MNPDDLKKTFKMFSNTVALLTPSQQVLFHRVSFLYSRFLREADSAESPIVAASVLNGMHAMLVLFKMEGVKDAPACRFEDVEVVLTTIAKCCDIDYEEPENPVINPPPLPRG